MPPDRTQQRIHLQTVLGTHFIQDKRFDGRFERAVADRFDLHAQLIQKSFIKYDSGSETEPGHIALRVQIYFIGGRSHIIGTLRIVIRIANDEFPGFFELQQRIADLLQRSHSHSHIWADIQVNPADPVVGRSRLDSFQHVDQSVIAGDPHRYQVVESHLRQRVARRIVADRLGKIEPQHRFLLHVGNRFRKKRPDTGQHHH